MPSKYEPLRRHLASVVSDRTRLSFAEIEGILRFNLPNSARQYAPWWANTGGSHIQADAWMSVGWRTSQVDVAGEKVTFERSIQRSASVAPPPEPRAAVEHSSAPFARDDMIVVSRAALRGGAIRLLEEFSEAHGVSLADSIAGMLNAMVVERRRQLLERFPMTGPPSAVDSADLIREDRDAR
jgi:hypothetical protein